MSINRPVAPESIRAFISSGVLLPMVWIHRGSSVPLRSVDERMSIGVESGGWRGDSWGTAFSVFGSSTGDCGVNISLVDPTVLVSSTENLLVEWGMGFTIDLPENPSLSQALWLAWPFLQPPSHPSPLLRLRPQGS